MVFLCFIRSCEYPKYFEIADCTATECELLDYKTTITIPKKDIERQTRIKSGIWLLILKPKAIKLVVNTIEGNEV